MSKKIDKSNVSEIVELNGVQKGMLFHHLKEEKDNIYNIQVALSIQGKPDIALLGEAFEKVQAANEVIRSVFAWEKISKPVQIILHTCKPAIQYHDYSNRPAATIQQLVQEHTEKDWQQKFDLTELPLRISLLKQSADSYTLLVTHHHILYDGWSTGILFKEWFYYYAELLKNKSAQQESKPAYKLIQQAIKKNRRPEEEQQYWKKYLEGYETAPLFAIAKAETEASEKVNEIRQTIPAEKIKSIAAAQNVTVASVLYAAYAMVLRQYSNREDIVFGITVAGRDGRVQGIERVMGNFINTVPLRIPEVADNTLAELITAINNELTLRNDYNSSSYYEINQWLNLSPDEKLLESAVVIENYPLDEAAIHTNKDFSIELKSVKEKTDLPFLVNIFLKDQLEIEIAYKTNAISHRLAGSFARHLVTLLEELNGNLFKKIKSIGFLSAAEKQQLLEEFNNTAKAIDRDKTFFELFRDQVAKTPARIAVEHNGQKLTYRQLHHKVAGLSAFLTSEGAGPGTQVALYMPRGIEMLVSILAIFRAEATYVPIDTEYPKERVKEILHDSEAAIVLATTKTKPVISEIQESVASIKICCTIDELYYTAYQNGTIQNRPGTSGLAYIIYTSGTTGKPKGVMIHQLGMVNHLYAKIEDLWLTEKDCIAQTASPCFDISIWQFLAGLLTGAKTYIIDSAKVLDPPLLLKELQDGAVTVFESVPSLMTAFLDALPAGTNNRLKNLRWMIPTGEALEMAVVKKWYNRFPAIRLLNAYGPTEASDDITHHIVEMPEENESVIPVGKPIRNTRIYILDGRLNLLPAGITGTIYVAGLGVGYGYWKDEAKTKNAFIPNPFVEMDSDYNTLYKTGDVGYFRDDGTIVYVGREDEQVKIKGNRIEPGEIQNRMTQLEGIRNAVVLVKGEGSNKFLLAYYVSDKKMKEAEIKNKLAATLPGYMVPAYFIQIDSLPLTANGKLNKKALPDPVVMTREVYVAPRSNEEKIVAGVWSKVLGIPAIGITQNFFSLGGDSIKSIQVSSGIRAAGYEISVSDIFTYPTIQQLANKMQALSGIPDQSLVTGKAALTPVQQWFYKMPFVEKHHYNQSVLLNFPQGITKAVAGQIMEKLQEQHDALRMVFKNENGVVQQWNQGMEMPVAVEEYELSNEKDTAATIAMLASRVQAGINLEEGPLLKTALFHTKDGARLLLVIHHLVVDGISWRILIEDIETLYRQLQKKEPLQLLLKTAPFLQWSTHLSTYAQSEESRKTKEYWKNILSKQSQPLARDFDEPLNILRDNHTETFSLSKEETSQLLTSAHTPFNTRIGDLLLTALLISIEKHYGINQLRVDLEGHGRETIQKGLDYSRTVGWFTSIYPVVLESKENNLTATIKQVKETLRKVPNNGIDYLLQAWPGNEKTAQISFNYLGQFDADISGNSFTIASEAKGDDASPNLVSPYDWDISGMITGGQLRMELLYSQKQYKQETIRAITETYRENLVQLINHCCRYEQKELTPADLTYNEISVEALQEIQQRYAVEDIYPLSPMQEGMLFHSLMDSESEQYFQQMTCTIKGRLDTALVEKSINELVQRYDVLRTAFLHLENERPLQVVVKQRKAIFQSIDVREACRMQSKKSVVQSYRKKDRAEKFRLQEDVLIRLRVLQTADDEYVFIWSHHHILMDGWCVGIIMREFRQLYAGFSSGQPPALPAVNSYAKYIQWLRNRNEKITESYWKEYLQGYEQTAIIPGKKTARTDQPFDAAEVQLILPKEQTTILTEVAAGSAVTLSTLLHAAWGILLSKYNNRKDVLYGTVVSGRPAEIAGIESMVGLFINTIPVRIQYTTDDTINDLLLAVQQTSIKSEPHSYHPLTGIQSLSELGRELLDHIMIVENYPVEINDDEETETGYSISNVQVYEQTNYDLSVVVIPGEEMLIKFAYNANLYSKETIEKIASRLSGILEQIMGNRNEKISSLSIVTDSERQRLVQELDYTDVLYPEEKTVQQLFEEQVGKYPDNIAVKYNQETITYRELNEKANRLAWLIRERGVGRDTIVGLLTDRSIETVIGMLAIMKAGGAYMPIDVDYPEERKQYLLKDSGTQWLLTTRDLQNDIDYSIDTLCIEEANDNQKDAPEIPCINQPGDLCYIIYTSGTTGNPKGVMVEHRNVVRLFYNDRFQFNFGKEDVWTMFHSHCFDFSVWEIYGALLFGGRVIIIPRMLARDTAAYLKLLKEEKVTVLNQTPSAFYNLIQEELACATNDLQLSYVIFGGEALSPGKLKAWQKKYPGVKLVNMFGITETTVHVTYKEIGQYEIDNNISNIGKPIPTLSVYVLDSDRNLVPAGVTGELYVGGAGVARGYLHKDELTAKKFIPNPYKAGDCLYRSGDLAKLLESGDIEYIGRIDDQVKIRGFRIELGEIENHINSHTKIIESIVLPRFNGDSKQLVAWYIASGLIDAAEIRAYLSGRLPEYMLPSFFIQLDKLPLTHNGKIDKKALPDPVLKAGQEYTAPRTKEEEILTEVWSKVLSLENISITDNFFAVGGDSIKSIQIISRMRAAGYEMSVKEVFGYPTIKEQAKNLRQLKSLPGQMAVTGKTSLSPIQQWLWNGPVNKKAHFNQSVLLNFPAGISREAVKKIFEKLQDHHDALRIVIRKEGEEIFQENKAPGIPFFIEEHDLRQVSDPEKLLSKIANQLQSGMDLEKGPLMQTGLFHMHDGSRLLVIIHHMVVDGVSWRILYEDIDMLHRQHEQGETLSLPAKTTPFINWPADIARYTTGKEYQKGKAYWEKVLQKKTGSIPRDFPVTENILHQNTIESFRLTEKETAQLLRDVHAPFNTQINDILLTALSLTIKNQFDIDAIRVDVEGHGREDIGQGNDYSRTVGWFTSIYPVLLENKLQNIAANIKAVKETLRKIPGNGIDYLLLKNDAATEKNIKTGKSPVRFNYLGQFDNDLQNKSFVPATEDKGLENDLNEIREYDLDISGMVTGGRLKMNLVYSTQQFKKETIGSFMQLFRENLSAIIKYCSHQNTVELTPSDITWKEILPAQLDDLQQQYDVEDVYLLSPMQKGMLFHSLLSPDSDHYFEQVTCRVKGIPDRAVIEKSMNELINRHAVLRTVFLRDGYEQPIQVVLKERKIEFSYTNIQAELETEQEELVLNTYKVKDRARKFDLAKDTLLRLAVVQTATDECVFIWSFHHIMMDGWCMGIMIKEFREIYAANRRKEKAELPEVKPYNRYITWLAERDKEASQLYWKKYLAGYEQPVSLPKKKPAQKEAKLFSQRYFDLTINKERTKKLQELSQRHGVTLNTVLQVAWGIMLSRYNYCRDVVFGSVVSGRPADIEGVESMIGLFINTIPVRIQYNAAVSIGNLLQEVQQRALETEPYHYQPLSEIQLLSEPGRALLDHIIVFENFPVAQELKSADITGDPDNLLITEAGLFEQANYDLSIVVMPAEELLIRFDYNTAVYADEMIQAVSRHLDKLLDEISTGERETVATVEMITEEEKQQCIRSFNYPALNYPKEETVLSLFEKQLQSTPNKIAVVFEEKTITYKELDEKSNRLSQYLLQLGITPGTLVPICMERSLENIIGILSILKSGAAYVPIDPQYPTERIAYMMEDTGSTIVVTAANCSNKIPEQLSLILVDELLDAEEVETTKAPGIKIKPHSLAYVIYTSGSTGKPKGAMVHHRNIVSLVKGGGFVELSEKVTLLSTGSPSFDATTFDYWGMLLNGGKLVLCTEQTLFDSRLFKKVITGNRVTLLFMTTGLFNQWVNLDVTVFDGLKTIITGGEKISERHIEKITKAQPDIDIIHAYGPTENTTFSLTHPIPYKEVQEIIPIGKALRNRTAYLLNQEKELCPVGVTGELYVGGDGVAMGYLNNPVLTAEKFIPDPFSTEPGAKLYRTGDMARWLPGGDIEFIGRKDDQVKIRGFRIELGEIENQLRAYAGIIETVVLVKTNNEGKYLVAYYVAEQEIEAAAIRNFLSGKLPDYMLPVNYVFLRQMPLNANGKIDKKALPDPEVEIEKEFVAPLTKEENLLTGIWCKVLYLEKVGVTDNFFAVGGDSIKSIQVVSGIREAGYEVTVKDIFIHQTIRELALQLREIKTVVDQSVVTGTSALTPVQHWFFTGPVKNKQQYNQSVWLQFNENISFDTVKKIFEKLQEHHDALRMVFKQKGTQFIQQNLPVTQPVWIKETDVRKNDNPEKAIVEGANEIQQSIDIGKGPLLKLGLFHTAAGSRLLIVIHHLIVDTVSWRIVFEDIDNLYRQVKENRTLSLPPKTTSFLAWANCLANYSSTGQYKKATGYWNKLRYKVAGQMPVDYPEAISLLSDSATVSFGLTKEETTALLTDAHNSFNTQVNDLLLAALLLTTKKMYGNRSLMMDMEGHGREEIQPGTNLSRTIGWFTSIYPVWLETDENGLAATIIQVKETLRKIPNKGIDYLLQQQNESGPVTYSPILFNYLGQFDADTSGKSFEILNEGTGDANAPDEVLKYQWDITALVKGEQFNLSLTYSKKQYKEETIGHLLKNYKESLRSVINYCRNNQQLVLTPSDLSFKELSIAQLNKITSEYTVEDIYPLSPMQEGMLFHSIVDEEAGHYFVQMISKVKGKADIQAIEKSMSALVARHAIFRTAFLHTGYERPLQLVQRQKETAFEFRDIREALTGASKEEVLQLYRLKDRAKKFNLQKDALMRLTILQTGTDEFEFIWSYHHILMDGWCMAVIIREFKELYAANRQGVKSTLPAVKPYAKYIEWLAGWNETASLQYWQNYLEGYESLAGLPRKENNLATVLPYKLASQQIRLNKNLLPLLQQRTAEKGVTINTFIQAAWAILLGKYNNTGDVVFGAVVSGRPAAIEAVESMIGLFINTIPVRIQYTGTDSVNDLLDRVQKSALECEPHHYNPLAAVQSVSSAGRGLLNHILLFENYPVEQEITGDSKNDALVFTGVETFEQTNYDLSVWIIPGDEIRIRFDYNENVYDAVIIQQVSAHLLNIIKTMLARPNAAIAGIEMLTAEEEQQLVYALNDTGKEFPEAETLVSVLEKQAVKTPAHIAVRIGDQCFTYRQIDESSRRLAAYLQSKGIVAGDLAGLMLEREEYLMPSIFGIMKVGAAYVPIDPHSPAERKKSIAEDSNLKVIITRGKFLDATVYPGVLLVDLDTLHETIENYQPLPPGTGPQGNDLAYVIYTSGSTGKPKGVMVEHRAVVNGVTWLQHTYPLKQEDVVLQKTPLVFDVSVWELFWWPFAGASLSLLEPGGEKDPYLVMDTIQKHKVTASCFVPSVLSVFLRALQEKGGYEKLVSMHYVFTCGEALKPEQVNLFRKTIHQQCGHRLINLYGPAESTVAVTYYECPLAADSTKVPIGKPFDNISMYVLDKDNRLSPPGVTGELHIGGTGLARGYLNNPALTKEKFIEHPYLPGQRIYKTGDYAKWMPDGNLEFMGRKDSQVKIRGFRIELGEVEFQLNTHEPVKECAVIVWEKGEDKSLVAYYVADKVMEATELRRYLAERLPDYMVPAHYVYMDKLPLTRNEKLDRKSLPAPEFKTGSGYTRPKNEMQRQLVHIWADILDLKPEEIGVETNFFDMGGNSFKILNMANRVNNYFNTNVSIAQMFKFPVISRLAEMLQENSQLPAEENENDMESMLEQRNSALRLYNNINE